MINRTQFFIHHSEAQEKRKRNAPILSCTLRFIQFNTSLVVIRFKLLCSWQRKGGPWTFRAGDSKWDIGQSDLYWKRGIILKSTDKSLNLFLDSNSVFALIKLGRLYFPFLLFLLSISLTLSFPPTSFDFVLLSSHLLLLLLMYFSFIVLSLDDHTFPYRTVSQTVRTNPLYLVER